MKQDIIISTVPVTIKVIEVGGKKMTKAVFDQIQEGEWKDFFPIDNRDKFLEHNFLGWVSTKEGHTVIYTKDGCLYKYRDTALYSFFTPQNQIFIAI